MSKKKRRNRAGKTKSKRKSENHAVRDKWTDSKRNTFPKLFFGVSWKVLSAIGLIVGLFVSIYDLTSKVSIEPDLSLNPENIFSAPFRIRNVGLTPIHEIWFYCRIREAKRADKWVVASDVLTRRERVPVPRLVAGEATATYCEYPFAGLGQIVYADIEVVVAYKRWIWTREIRRRFVTVQRHDGTNYWIEKGLSEP